MFGSKKNTPFANGGHTLFDRAVEIHGTVKFAGTLDIEGKVFGDIMAVDGSDALVRVREQGAVEGDIRAPKVIINGMVKGDVHSNKHLELAAKAVVHGNVHYSVIEMVKGAEVNGNLIHEMKKDGSTKKPAPGAEPAAKAAAPDAPAKVS
ncbi:hypothetical protein TDB9533_00122 [Thalassocella blandensis]|nr:hypothetical protein TDB9533_00122 [Thalassocella blandensis]